MKYKVLFLMLVLITACDPEPTELGLPEETLAGYIEANNDLALDDLIACAGGMEGGIFGETTSPTTIFFYPIEGATDFKYFETDNVADSMNFGKYMLKELPETPVFNGYLWAFENTPFIGEKMGVVTFLTQGKLHVCTPIRQKTNIKPTEVNPDLLYIGENGSTSPEFSWQNGMIDENVIYFQVISDSSNNFISGTYTYDQNFTFYNLDNVVLNITDSTTTPILETQSSYKFTLMGVSEDNWVNLFIEKEFSTD